MDAPFSAGQGTARGTRAIRAGGTALPALARVRRWADGPAQRRLAWLLADLVAIAVCIARLR
jgi:hypothetical protein